MKKPVDESLYRRLGVTSDASVDAIRDAYYVLAKTYHPNSGVRNPAQEDEFEEIVRAAAILRDPQRRRLYDDGVIDSFGKLTERGSRRRSGVSRKRIVGAMALGASTGVALVLVYFLRFASGPEDLTVMKNGVAQREERIPVKNMTPIEVGIKETSNAQKLEEIGGGKTVSIAEPAREVGRKSGTSNATSSHDVERSYLPPSLQGKRTASLEESSGNGSDAAVEGSVQAEQPVMKAGTPQPAKTVRGRTANQNRIKSANADNRQAFGLSDDDFVPREGSGANKPMKQTSLCLACLTQSDVDCVKVCR